MNLYWHTHTGRLYMRSLGWDKWVEYRPKLKVFDAICAPGYVFPIAARMAQARKLRTDDLFAAIGFLARDGNPSPIIGAK